MSTPPPIITVLAAVRLLIMDPQRKLVALCKTTSDLHWSLPYGLLDAMPHDVLEMLIYRLPWAVHTAIYEQINEAVPIAWVYPPETIFPRCTELQIVYLFTLAEAQMTARSGSRELRAFRLSDLPEDLTPLEGFLIETVREAADCHALPYIELRPERTVIHTIGDTSYANSEPVRVIGGGAFADTVADYVGYCGIVTGVTNTCPRWFCVQLDAGKQIVALPHHIEPLAWEMANQCDLLDAPNRDRTGLSRVASAWEKLHVLTRCLQAQSQYSEAACCKALQTVLALSGSSPVETILILLGDLNLGLKMPTIVQQFGEAARRYLHEHPRYFLWPQVHQFVWSQIPDGTFPGHSSTDQLYIYGSPRPLYAQEMLLSNVWLVEVRQETRMFLGPCYERVKCYLVTHRRLTRREQQAYNLTLLHCPNPQQEEQLTGKEVWLWNQ